MSLQTQAAEELTNQAALPVMLSELQTKFPTTFDNLNDFIIPLICQIVFKCTVLSKVNRSGKRSQLTPT